MIGSMDWQRYLEANQAKFEAELIEFLRIPSISSLPEHAADVAHAAEWVAAKLRAIGMQRVELWPTGGHPVVYGEHLEAPGKPTVLIYGHFDTQPVDPIALWEHPPFEPQLRDGVIVARGASDDKGNMLVPLLALEALLATEGLPLNVKLLFEGQEEIGSPQLPAVIAANRERLACDLVLSADGAQWQEDQPALWLGLRGLCALQIDVKGPASDLHSGGFGGAVQNPLHALVALLASMRASDGRILVAGFYDKVRPLSEAERRQIAEVPFDEDAYARELGVAELFGEAGYSTLERLWARPTLEINGLWGGFQGEGVKTVLPSSAHAKLTCRLVADQDPAEIVALLRRHIAEHTPPGVRVQLREEESAAKPYLMPSDHPGNRVAAAVLSELYGKPPYYVRAGGSIPFCSLVLETLGVYTVNFAFGLPDERAHAPNEFFRLSSFRRGQQAYALLLKRLAELPPAALSTPSPRPL